MVSEHRHAPTTPGNTETILSGNYLDWHVRFGSQADMCAAIRHVRFTSNSDRESEIPQKAMSALPPKADMCGALTHVCFGPIADIARLIRSPRRRSAGDAPVCRGPTLWRS